jgi:hypothetical protein
MTTGKKTPSAIITTLGASPMPSQRIMSGSSAIFGSGYVAAMSGLPTASASREVPRTRPTRVPVSAPSAKPSPIRRSESPRCRASSPLVTIRPASTTTLLGGGRNSGGTQPTRLAASQSTTSPSTDATLTSLRSAPSATGALS